MWYRDSLLRDTSALRSLPRIFCKLLQNSCTVFLEHSVLRIAGLVKDQTAGYHSSNTVYAFSQPILHIFFGSWAREPYSEKYLIPNHIQHAEEAPRSFWQMQNAGRLRVENETLSAWGDAFFLKHNTVLNEGGFTTISIYYGVEDTIPRYTLPPCQFRLEKLAQKWFE